MCYLNLWLSIVDGLISESAGCHVEKREIKFQTKISLKDTHNRSIRRIRLDKDANLSKLCQRHDFSNATDPIYSV